MQKNKNRSGLALGAIVALLGTMFGALPASAAAVDSQQIQIRPVAGTSTNFNGLLTEDFPIYAQMQEGATSSNFAEGKVVWHVTKVSGPHDVIVVASTNSANSIPDGANATLSSTAHANAANGKGWITESSTVKSVTVSAKLNSADVGALYVRAYSASGIASTSANVVLTVRVFIDNQGGVANGVWDSEEWFSLKTITLHSTANVPTGLTLTSPTNGDELVTASANVGALNTANLDGVFFLSFEASTASFAITGGSVDVYTKSADLNGLTVQNTKSGVVSASVVAQALPAATTVSVSVRYDKDGTGSTWSDGVVLGDYVTKSSGVDGVTSLTLTTVGNADLTESSGVFLARANQSYTFKIGAISGSASVASKVVAVSLTSSATGLAAGVKYLSVNGGAATTSFPSAISVTTGADGFAALTVVTTGFGSGDDFWVNATVGGTTVQKKVDIQDVDYTLAGAYDRYKTGPGTGIVLSYTVEDQWGQAPAAAEQMRLMVTRGGHASFSYATTISFEAVTAGAGSFTYTPSPATVTGAASVTVDLQKWSAASNRWENTSDQVVTPVNVSTAADDFDSAIATSYSVSVSYFPNTVSYVAVSGDVDNTGSSIVASAPGLIFKNAAGVTSSGTITVNADASRDFSFSVAGEKAGTYTLTLTNGSATTTSLIIVDPAAHDSGRAITFDVTSIDAGKTRVITGTVTDANGNPVNTTGGAGTASVLVTFAGTAGIPVGAMPTETNADGEFQVSILTSAADRGSFTLTASYLKAGANTATADVVTVVQVITVGAAVATPASDQKLTVGSFKGFVAIYALNYTGQKLSAKVAGKWLVVNELSRFQRVVRNTGAGYTIKVDLYIDGAFVRSETVVTK